VSEPRWLPVDVIVETNRDLVEETGEPHLLLFPHLLESATAKPWNMYYYGKVEDVVELATALLFGIARNHPFQQGNKRTGFLSAIIFLEQNGYTLSIPDTDLLGRYINLVIEGKMTEDDFVKSLKPYIREWGGEESGTADE
jgi:death-on-curing protein